MTKYFLFIENCVRCHKTKKRRRKHNMDVYGKETLVGITGTCDKCKKLS